MAEATVIGQLTGGSPSVMKEFSPLLVPVLLLMAGLLWYLSAGATTSNKKQGKRLPPSPPALPVLGHLHLIGPNPQVSMRDLAVRHGGEDLMLLRLGTVPTLVASSPRAAQAVLRTHDQALASRPRSIFMDILRRGSSVSLAPYGNKWRQAKKLISTHMLSAKKVQSQPYRALLEEEVAVVIDQIRSAAMAGAPADLTELLSLFTTDIVCRAVVGRAFREGGVNIKFRNVINSSTDLLAGFNPESCYPGLAKVAGGVLMWRGRRKAERLIVRWDEIFDTAIDQHASAAAAAAAVGGPEPHETDFIDVMLSTQEEYGLTREDMKGILADMFAAGTDTTYLVLEFTMAELMMHKDIMARLQAEVRSVIMPKDQQVITDEDITRMPYLKAVIKESLRLHPPVPLLIPHQSLEECTIDGYVIPAGTNVLVNFWAISRDPRFWDAPLEFKPERFVFNKGATEAAAVDFRGLDFRYLPFGSGRRICAGTDFAMDNVELMLANLMCHFDWDIPGGATKIDMTEVFGLSVHRKEKLILNPRLPSSRVAQPLEG